MELLFLNPDSGDPLASTEGAIPGESGESKPGSTNGATAAKTAPAAPSGLAAKSTGGGIELNWKANADKDKVKSYTVYYSEKEDGKFEKIGTATGATQFRYYAVSFDGFYRITATNEYGESKPSATVKYVK